MTEQVTYAQSVAVVSALLSVLRRFLEPPAQRVPGAWIHCPVCGRDLAGPYPVGAIVPGPAGPFVDSPSHEELIERHITYVGGCRRSFVVVGLAVNRPSLKPASASTAAPGRVHHPTVDRCSLSLIPRNRNTAATETCKTTRAHSSDLAMEGIMPARRRSRPERRGVRCSSPWTPSRQPPPLEVRSSGTSERRDGCLVR